MKVNARQFHEKIARMEAQRKAARHEALEVIGKSLSEWIDLSSPKDTRRFIRGYLTAFQQVGHLGVPVPELRPSKYVGRAIQMLVEQYDQWRDTAEIRRRRLLERYPNGAPRGQRAAYNKMRREVVKAQNLATRAREELEKYRAAPYGIIMSPLRWVYDTRQNDGRHLVTVRPMPYGGNGVLVDRPTRTTARMINQEPHAVFIERQHDVLDKAFGMAALSGTIKRKAAEKYLRGFRNAANVQGAARARFLAGR